jgi:murein DD-endopeptidase MepM/ murein hydrolase activator NlpD
MIAIADGSGTEFTRMLIRANALEEDNFTRWVFCRGMQYQSDDKWWGDLGRRDFPHEGIDFCLYEDRDGRLRRIRAATRIPVMHDGRVRAVFRDYLGHAVIIEHRLPEPGAGTFVSAYAHTRPADTVRPGAKVKKGDVIATIARIRRPKARILPHLHFTLGRPVPGLDYGDFVWDNMRCAEKVTLLDPMGLVDWPWSVRGRGAMEFIAGAVAGRHTPKTT